VTNLSLGHQWFDAGRQAAVRLGLVLMLLATARGGGDHEGGDNGLELIPVPPYRGPPPSLESTTLPPGPTEEIDLVGTLTAPMPGCLVVKSDKGLWELVGRVPDELAVGDEVEVFGQVARQGEGRCGAPVVYVQKIAILRSVGRPVG
jgi:hypothetical protein